MSDLRDPITGQFVKRIADMKAHRLEYMRVYRREHRERLRELARQRHDNGQSRDVRDPLKVWARMTLNHAVRDRHIAKPTTCQRCHRERLGRLLHGHHHDYARPLEVEWLCSECHGLESQRERSA